MDEPPHHPRFRRSRRSRPRRAATPRPRAASEAQAHGPLDPALQPPENTPQDGDAEGGIHALLHHGKQLAEHDHFDEATQVLARASALAEAYQLPSLEAQAL